MVEFSLFYERGIKFEIWKIMSQYLLAGGGVEGASITHDVSVTVLGSFKISLGELSN